MSARSNSARQLDAGAAVAALGAVLLLVSLFLDWYGDDEEGLTAWTLFEVLDLLLAAIALWTIATFLRRSGVEPRLPDGPLVALGAAALLLTVSQMVDEPPAVSFTELDLKLGAWLALAGAAILLAGALMSVARVSLSVSVEHPPPAADPESETVAMRPPDRPV